MSGHEWACEAFVLIFQFAGFVENVATVVTSMSQRSERVIPAGRVLPGYPLGYPSTTACAGGRFGRDGHPSRFISGILSYRESCETRATASGYLLYCAIDLEAPKRTRGSPVGGPTEPIVSRWWPTPR